MSEEAGETIRTGACLCGKVRYQLQGAAANFLWNTVCHCLNCRRRTGCPFYTAAICLKDGFTITSGADNLSTYTDTMTDSTKPLHRQWCSTCGSNMFNYTALAEHIVSISAGTLDDFEDWKPTLEQYCIHRASFVDEIRGVNERYIEDLEGELDDRISGSDQKDDQG